VVEPQTFVSGFFGVFTSLLTWVALAMAGLGIFLAYAMYSAKWISAEKTGQIFKPFYNLFFNRYWLDALYEKFIVGVALLGGLFARLQWFDTSVVDGAVNGAADSTITSGRVIRHVQNGQLQLYALSIGTGLVIIIICVFVFGR